MFDLGYKPRCPLGLGPERDGKNLINHARRRSDDDVNVVNAC